MARKPTLPKLQPPDPARIKSGRSGTKTAKKLWRGKTPMDKIIRGR